TVLVAHARSMGQQQVLVGDVRVGVEGDGGYLVRAVERGAVQRFDVAEQVFDLESVGGNAAARETEEHEGVIGIGAVGDGDLHRRYFFFSSFFDPPPKKFSRLLKFMMGERNSWGVTILSIS